MWSSLTPWAQDFLRGTAVALLAVFLAGPAATGILGLIFIAYFFYVTTWLRAKHSTVVGYNLSPMPPELEELSKDFDE